MNIQNCPSCLKEGYREFCPRCCKVLFNGKRISPILPFSRPDYNVRKRDQVSCISISGVQSKHSVRLQGTELTLTEDNGEFILKPIMPGELDNNDSMPANEHFTMQCARQVFKLHTAECATVFFSDDLSPAYLVKRFDITTDGTRYQQEDFAQIAEATEETQGKDYKYGLSYEKIATLMKQHVSTYTLEAEKFFKLLIFNYLVHNGDAHLKNFSLFRDPVINGYLLTPAYDLLNTRLHLPNESAMALDLFEDDFETKSHTVNGFYRRDDFAEFGRRVGLPSERVDRIIDFFISRQHDVDELLRRSFLDNKNREKYSEMVRNRVRAIGYSSGSR